MTFSHALAYRLNNLALNLPTDSGTKVKGSNSKLYTWQHSCVTLTTHYLATNIISKEPLKLAKITAVVESASNNQQSIAAWQLLQSLKIPDYFLCYPIYRNIDGTSIYVARIQNLEQYLQTPSLKLTLSDVKLQAAKIIVGVYELHQRQIAHRDLKPNNILVSIRNNEIHLEIADLHDIASVNYQTGKPLKITHYMGTYEYVAPELIKYLDIENKKMKICSEEYSTFDLLAIDIYALGKVLAKYLNFFDPKSLKEEDKKDYENFCELINQLCEINPAKRIKIGDTTRKMLSMLQLLIENSQDREINILITSVTPRKRLSPQEIVKLVKIFSDHAVSPQAQHFNFRFWQKIYRVPDTQAITDNVVPQHGKRGFG